MLRHPAMAVIAHQLPELLKSKLIERFYLSDSQYQSHQEVITDYMDDTVPGGDDKLNSRRGRIWYAILTKFKQPLIKGN